MSFCGDGTRSTGKETDCLDTSDQAANRHSFHDRWLNPAPVENQQFENAKIRADYPGTGQWLLNNKTFIDWFSPLYPTIPPLLWLNGKPGAGR